LLSYQREAITRKIAEREAKQSQIKKSVRFARAVSDNARLKKSCASIDLSREEAMTIDIDETALMATSPRPGPAFEKLLIGPVMVLGEMITGGHYFDVLTLRKQMIVGHCPSPSYWELHLSNVNQWGYLGSFYRGFFPWGLCQCVKGVPVLFAQHESMYQLQQQGWSQNTAEKTSGFVGGMCQALFINPLQKIKVTAVAMGAVTPRAALATVIERHGLVSLFDGLAPSILRRGLDWGIRFGVACEIKNMVVGQKLARGESPVSCLLLLLLCISYSFLVAVSHPKCCVLLKIQKDTFRL
jgi:hypothetical protein